MNGTKAPLFKKAEKKKAKLRLGVTGPSGSGKTFSALRLATGFGGKIAVIDTEKGSASLYADKFEFDVLELDPPFAPERYIEAMNAAVQAGYEIIIMDSISHAWAGDGGLLNQKEQLDARGGNSFTNWAKMTPKQERFISALIGCPAHLIVTMRSKQEHVQISEGGKTKIQKVGLAPIQRDGFEYELTTVFDVAINHECETSKDRTGLFVDKIFKIDENTGKTFRQWLESGVEITKEKPDNKPDSGGGVISSESNNASTEATTQKTTIQSTATAVSKTLPNAADLIKIDFNQANDLKIFALNLGFSVHQVSELVVQLTGKNNWGDVNQAELRKIKEHLEENKKVRKDHE